MPLTAFFMDDAFGLSGTTVHLPPSGEAIGAPLSNALEDRPRVTWQTDGYFSIDSGRYIDLKEGAGSELNILLPHIFGDGDNIAYRLELALNLSALTSLTYTVRYLSDRRFRIEASGTFSLLWATGTNTASNAREWLGYDNSDLTGGTSYNAQERRYSSDTWVVFDLGSAKAIDLLATVLDGGDDASFSTVKIYGNASILSLTDRAAWDGTASLDRSFSSRPAEEQNRIQVAMGASGATMTFRYWAFSWRHFDEDAYHAVGILKALVKYTSTSRQITQLSGHGIIDDTPEFGVNSYYPVQGLQRWRAPLNFDAWASSDYRSVVTAVVRNGRAKGIVWSLRWDQIADGTYDADDEADKGFLLWCSLRDYSEDDYTGAASDFISGELVVQQVR